MGKTLLKSLGKLLTVSWLLNEECVVCETQPNYSTITSAGEITSQITNITNHCSWPQEFIVFWSFNLKLEKNHFLFHFFLEICLRVHRLWILHIYRKFSQWLIWSRPKACQPLTYTTSTQKKSCSVQGGKKIMDPLTDKFTPFLTLFPSSFWKFWHNKSKVSCFVSCRSTQWLSNC